jgi:CHAT domain-containing protein
MCYNNTLHLKGVLLNNYIQTHNNIKNKGNIVLNMELEEWQKTERLLNKNREILNEDTKLKLKTENAERFRKLKEATVDFNTSNAFWNTTYLDVQQKLRTTETAIEFVSFAKHGSKDTVYLAALLLLKTGAPLYIPLGTEAEINALLARTQDSDSEETAINAIYTKNKTALYAQVWEPIESILKAKNIKDIYYAPSGALHNVAFEAVVADKVGYNLHRVSSTRQLVSRDDAAQAPTSIVAFGDIPYFLDDDEVHKLKAKNDSINKPKNVAKRNGTLSYFPLLENTAQEIKALATIAKQNKILFEPKTQLNANETAFKNMGTTQANAKITLPTVLHIATHGFYLLQNTTQTDSTGAAQLAANTDPLQRCGLAFAGANAYWSNPNIYVKNAKSTESSDNGILTANEIAQCNLRETDLVVLSACESALGDVNGEGVFGLQRGFKQAGAKSILMTLWQVDDAATAEMMTAFYTEYLTNKQTKREALRRAQEKMKRSKDYHTPYFWAGFVLLD